MNCAICNDTGKRHGSDYLDCSCAAATARRELQLAITAFIAEYPLGGDLNSDLHWFIHQRATRLAEAEMQAMAQEYKAQIDDLDQQNTALTNDNRGMAAERELHMARIDELERQLLKALGTPENDWCPECHLRESTTDPKDKRIAELERENGNLRYELNAALSAAPSAPAVEQQFKLDNIEQYRQQMAGISTAALGYWKEGDSIHPDYDTPALRDVAKLYAKYDALYRDAEATQAADTDKVRDAMAAQAPVREVPGWVSVAERMPELTIRDENKVVIEGRTIPATTSSERVLVALDSGARQIDRATRLDGGEHTFFQCYGKRVKYWQPLPAAPVQQEGE